MGVCWKCGLPHLLSFIPLHSLGQFGSKDCPYQMLSPALMHLYQWNAGLFQSVFPSIKHRKTMSVKPGLAFFMNSSISLAKLWWICIGYVSKTRMNPLDWFHLKNRKRFLHFCNCPGKPGFKPGLSQFSFWAYLKKLWPANITTSLNWGINCHSSERLGVRRVFEWNLQYFA